MGGRLFNRIYQKTRHDSTACCPQEKANIRLRRPRLKLSDSLCYVVLVVTSPNVHVSDSLRASESVQSNCHSRSIAPSALWPSFRGSISCSDGRGLTAADSSSFLLMFQSACGGVPCQDWVCWSAAVFKTQTGRRPEGWGWG